MGKAAICRFNEAKLFHQYDHRFGTFDGVSAKDIQNGNARPMTAAEKADPESVVIPRYWVPENEVAKRLDKSGAERTDLVSLNRPTGEADRPTATGRQADRRRQADRPTGRQADRPTGPTGRQADRPTGRQADRPTGRQADRPTGRQADRPTGRQAVFRALEGLAISSLSAKSRMRPTRGQASSP